MHCAQKRDLWPRSINFRLRDKSIIFCRPCKTFEYRLFSILLAIFSFRLSGRCLSNISLCWLRKPQGQVNWRNWTSKALNTYSNMFKVDKELITFPISDLEHCIDVQTGANNCFIKLWWLYYLQVKVTTILTFLVLLRLSIVYTKIWPQALAWAESKNMLLGLYPVPYWL